MATKNEYYSEKLYKKYFDVKSTPVRGTRAIVKEDAVKEAKRYFGFFALLSNDKMDSMTALALYRNKDLVEKACVRQPQGAAQLPQDVGLLRAEPQWQAVCRIRRVDIPVLFEQADA